MALDSDGLAAEEDLLDIYSSMYDLDLKEKDAAVSLHVYASPVLLVVGTIGNLISCIVLYKMCEKVLTTCLYLFVICIIDLMVLYIRCGNLWVYHMTQPDSIDIEVSAKHSSNSVCKIYPFVSNFALHLSIWLLVAMATETTIVTLRPDRLLRVCVLERAKAVILLIIVLLVCVNAHCFWTFALVKDKTDNQGVEICSNVRQGQINEEFRRIVWPIIDILVTHFFPYFTIFSCTVIMITMRVKKRKRNEERDILNIWKQYPLDGPGAKDFHFTILVICVTYLILMVTKFATDIFLFLARPESLKLVEYSFVLDVKMMLADTVCQMLHYMFLCSKFFIFIGTSKRFREELRLILTCRSCRRRRRPHPVNNRCISNRTPTHISPDMENKTPILGNHQPHHHYDHHPHHLLDPHLPPDPNQPLNQIPMDIPNQYNEGFPPPPPELCCNSLEKPEKKSFAITSV